MIWIDPNGQPMEMKSPPGQGEAQPGSLKVVLVTVPPRLEHRRRCETLRHRGPTILAVVDHPKQCVSCTPSRRWPE